MHDLFICHSSADHSFVTWLSNELGKKGIKTWVDEGELSVGHSLIGKIEEGISKTKYFAVIISKNSVKCRWVKIELEMAFTKEFKEDRVFILPILIEKCEIPLYVERKKYADFTKSPEKGLSEILQVLVGKSQFECLVFRQKKPGMFPKKGSKGRQKFRIVNHSGIKYNAEDVPVILRGSPQPQNCFFSIKLKNLTDQIKENVKVKLSFQSNNPEKKIREFLGNKAYPPVIVSGGIGSSYVAYNIPIIHPYDNHRFGLVTTFKVWPHVEIIAESSIWDGKVNRFDVIPEGTEYANFPKFKKR